MKLITRLNEKLNYNVEMFYLFGALSLVFGITANILLRAGNQIALYSSVTFLAIAVVCLGITLGYLIYNRNDNINYGYRIKEKIENLFKFRRRGL